METISTLELHPISGCSMISPGCANCYAMKVNAERYAKDPTRQGLTKETAAGHRWTGALNFNEALINQPLRLPVPTWVFVCNHGDLFHEDTPQDWIDRVFAVMEAPASRQHTFAVLTKRADKMKAYLNQRYKTAGHAPRHIHFGVSCERQEETDLRIPLLLDANAAVCYVSFYPLLGLIHFTRVQGFRRTDYVSTGVEDERPAPAEWVAAIKQQCREAGIRYMFGKRLN